MEIENKSKINYYNGNNGRPMVLAHRGSSGLLPENTIESFDLAIEEKADFIELDVVLTKEKQLIVFHDSFLNRITNINDFPEFSDRIEERNIGRDKEKLKKGFFSDKFTVEELKKLRIRQMLGKNRSKFFDEKFQIPLLSEVLDYFIEKNKKIVENNKKPVGIFLEVKNGWIYRRVFGKDFEIGKIVIEELEKKGLNSLENASKICPIVIQSFDMITLDFLLKNSPFPGNALVAEDLFTPLEIIKEIANGVGVTTKLVFDSEKKVTDYVAKAKALGLKVFVFTIKDDDLSFGETNLEQYYILYKTLQVDGFFCEHISNAVMALNSIECFSNCNKNFIKK